MDNSGRDEGGGQEEGLPRHTDIYHPAGHRQKPCFLPIAYLKTHSPQANSWN